ncbi:MAG: hypothetical protein ACK5XP_11730 [Sphingobacteriia bacterium]
MKISNYQIGLFFGLYIAVFLLYNLNSEKQIINGGVGSDGFLYYTMARSSEQEFRDRKFESYWLGRMLLPRIAHYAEKAFSQVGLVDSTRDVKSMTQTHLFLNALWMTIIFLIIRKLGAHFGMNNVQILWTLIVCFLNFSFFRVFGYDPLFTDIFVSMLVITAVYFHVIQAKTWMMLGIYFLILFSHPAAFLFVLPLILFLDLDKSDKYNYSLRSRLTIVYKFLMFAFILCFTLFWAYYVYTLFNQNRRPPFSHTEPVNFYLLPLSLVIYVGYLIFLHKKWSQLMLTAMASFKFQKKIAIVFVCLLAMVLFRSIIIDSISSGSEKSILDLKGGKLWNLPAILFFIPLVNPGISFVAHFLYYGSFVLMILVFNKNFYKKISQLNNSLILVTGLFFVFLLDSESRRITFFIPLFSLLVIQSISISHKRQLLFTALLLGLGIIFSGFWVYINEWSEGLTPNHYQSQLWLNFHGPWMKTWFYGIGAALFLPCLWLFWYIKKRWTVPDRIDTAVVLPAGSDSRDGTSLL